ncbi:MAG: DUF5615 family PIN-like protein, partial [Bacteroidia bacterium]|nr:DUF5615 family PIN-like protein [Bacteroidia bacterium]
ADDRQVWEFARQAQFAIITKDNDFNELSQLLGYPPYVIWIRRGNCSTTARGRKGAAPFAMLISGEGA